MVFIFYSEGGIRKAALRNMPVACFNRRGFSAEKESHRPDLSARSIRRDGRLLAECRWHSATAVAFPQKRNPTFSAGRAGGIQTHLKKIPQSTKFFLRAANFLSCKSPQKPRKSSIFHRFYRQFTVFENFSNFFAIFVDKGGYPCYNISCR